MFKRIKKKAALSALIQLGIKMIEQSHNYNINPGEYVEPSWEMAIDMLYEEIINLTGENDA